jgi:predicted phosphoribosyltransferase
VSDPRRAVVCALSAGGVEVARPVASLLGQPPFLLEPPRFELPPVAGCPVLLVDDGRASIDDLSDAACLLRGAGAVQVLLATAWPPPR